MTQTCSNLFRMNGVVRMTENELGKILREMYDNAPPGYQVAKFIFSE